MANPETLKDILAFYESRLPAVCPNIRKVEILPGDWFDLLSPVPTLPMVALIPGGWSDDQELDAITEYRINIAVFAEHFDHNPRAVVMGSAKFPGLLALTAEVLAGMQQLGDPGVDGYISGLPAANAGGLEAGTFDEKDEKRLAVRQRSGYLIRVNE